MPARRGPAWSSNVLFNFPAEEYGGQRPFAEMVDFYKAQFNEEFHPTDSDTPEERAWIEQTIAQAEEAAKVALEIYDRHVGQEGVDEEEAEAAAAEEMKGHELESVRAIGEALEGNDWSQLAV